MKTFRDDPELLKQYYESIEHAITGLEFKHPHAYEEMQSDALGYIQFKYPDSQLIIDQNDFVRKPIKKMYDVELSVDLFSATLNFYAYNAYLENDKTLVIDGLKIESIDGDCFHHLTDGAA